MKNLWKEYQVENQSNGFLQKNQEDFCNDLKSAGATDQEIQDILDCMWQTDTFYRTAKEAIDDLRDLIAGTER